MSNVYRNPRDSGTNAENGRKTEALFEASVRAAGWNVLPAPAHQDYEQHIDCTIEWVGSPSLHGGDIIDDGAAFTVDVKSDSKSALVWVEIRNIHGDGGWLYGKADLIAFARDNGFLIVDRDKLRVWIEENVEKTYVTRKSDALMKVYTRDGRKDMITRVQNYHLIALSDGKIPYA